MLFTEMTAWPVRALRRQIAFELRFLHFAAILLVVLLSGWSNAGTFIL
jgi:hypothetical protein